MPAVASLPISPVLGQLRGLIADGESVPSTSQVVSLMQVLAAVPDPRKRRGVRHRLATVLVMSVCAVLGGMRSFVAIAQWARDSIESCPQLREQLGGITVAPAESTFRRTLQRLDAAQLDRLLGAWAQTRTAAASVGGQAGLRAVAADGKTLRGSGSPQSEGGAAAQRHLLTVFDHTHGIVLGQVDVDARSTWTRRPTRCQCCLSCWTRWGWPGWSSRPTRCTRCVRTRSICMAVAPTTC